MKTVKLSSLVSSICAGNYCQTDLVQFINMAQKISLSYLKFQEVLGKRISGERMETDIELEDLAMDCIAELFSRNDNGEFVQLRRYYLPKYDEAELSDADVLVLTRRLVVRKTKQELSRIFRERDPEGAKIVRNIKVAVRNSDKLNLFREMGREYIYYTNGHDIDPLDQQAMHEFLRREKSTMSEDLLNSRFIEIYQPNDSVSTCIRKLFERIYYYEDYQNFLSLDSIVKLVRSIKFDAFRERLLEDDFVATPVDELESKEIESYISVVMKTVGQKIESQYLRTGKLGQERADIYYQALRDVLHDLIQKKDNSSYYRNLKYYLPELSQQEYRSEERSVFEYLAKVAKREFRKHLKELL